MTTGEAVGIGEENDAIRADPGDLAFDISRDLICTASDDGRLSSLNTAWETTLGWGRAELMSRPLVEFVHPADADRTRLELARVGEGDRELIAFESRFRTRGGEYRWLHWKARSDGET